ncbi:patatin-like phospholipase family protein [Rufibacter roseus]|uniref:Patatin-like phospholipase family protein n=1 Tax=Rufibacter roseus TaxID=1567108 RepID=A0ABW2DPC0_9BACT|nr:patatin-like phospholipase family protein [Rufibacter roseus]
MRLGVCLSGGGARGVAHLGVLKALQEIGVVPDVISGVSSGAIAAAFVAAGYTPDEVLKLINDLSLSRLIKPSLNRGLLNSKALSSIFKEHLSDLKIEELDTKLIISALDLVQGVTIYYTEGDLAEALVASSSVPVVFKPVSQGKKLMVDGGLINNLPVECLQGECDKIIGVHVNPIHHSTNIDSIKQVTERIFHLAINENVRHRVQFCDLYLEPPKLMDYHVYGIDKTNEVFEIGYTYTHELASEIIQLLK